MSFTITYDHLLLSYYLLFSLFTMLQGVIPSDMQPDMSHITLIKESEIRRGHMIGSGAFGTVYRVCETVYRVCERIV